MMFAMRAGDRDRGAAGVVGLSTDGLKQQLRRQAGEKYGTDVPRALSRRHSFSKLLLSNDYACVIKPYIDSLRQIASERSRQFSDCSLECFVAGSFKLPAAETLAHAIGNIVEEQPGTGTHKPPPPASRSGQRRLPVHGAGSLSSAHWC
jgi:hypothetical protein